MRYHAPPQGVLKPVRLDGMTAIYDRRSTQTHVVAQIVPSILDALQPEATTAEALAARLNIPPSQDLVDRLDEMVVSGLLDAS